MVRFERPLDIRSFVSVYTDLALLIKLIFSDQQALLFQYHRARAITYKSNKKGSDVSSSIED